MRTGTLQLRRLTRRRWLALALAGGVAYAVAVAALAAGDEGLARQDALRQGGVALMLLGGLALALALGGSSLNRDSDSGHFGMLMGAGVGRGSLVAGALLARAAALLFVLAVWAVALILGGAALGAGADGDMAVHAAVSALGLVLIMVVAAAASSVVGRAAAALFGVAVYVTVQGMMNLKAAADQNIIGTAAGTIDAVHRLVPQFPTSPMLADLQARDAAGGAIPRIDINGNEVILTATGTFGIVWTLAWIVGLALLAYAGMRRRPIA